MSIEVYQPKGNVLIKIQHVKGKVILYLSQTHESEKRFRLISLTCFQEEMKFVDQRERMD